MHFEGMRVLPKSAAPAVTRLRDVTLIREGKVALKNISFTVLPGEHWVLLGPNGSGKSSLLAILQGWLWPQQGSVEVLGRHFGDHDLSEMRRHIGWVGLEIEKEFPRWQSVRDIVASGGVGTIGVQFDAPNAAIFREAERSLRQVGLGGYCDRPCHQLSQGQGRLLTIARALMTQPRLLILDEPCTGLDPVARERFLRRLATLLRRRTSPSAFYVTHHVEEILPEFTHALLLKEGNLVSQGKIATVLNPENLKNTFGSKVRLKREKGRYRMYLE
jgi:iron complex transport system ATP-binding protein